MTTSRVEIYQVKAFVAVARVGNLTKAAEALRLTQPAVTAQIKAIEQSLGVALFDRSSGRMSLSRAGEMLLPHAERLLTVAGEMQGVAQLLKGKVAGIIEIGVPGEPPDFFRIGQLSVAVIESMPLVELRMRTQPMQKLTDEVRAGRLAGCFAIGLHPPRDLQWISLRTVTFRVAIPIAHKPAMQKGNWATLAALPWLDGSTDSHIHLMLREMFEQQGLAANVVLRSDDTASLDALVRSGGGCALLREEIALRGAEMEEWLVWGHAKINAELFFALSKEQAGDPAVVALLSVVQEVWRPD